LCQFIDGNIVGPTQRMIEHPRMFDSCLTELADSS
jgi:hypothetical protein